VRHASGDDGDHALMLVVSNQRFKSSIVNRVHRNAGSLGALGQLAHATIMARVSNIEAAHTFWLRAQSSDYGMKSEQMSRVGHEEV
jgi:hypothetical protein